MRNEAVLTKKLLGEIVKHAKKAMAEIDKVNALLLRSMRSGTG